MSRLRALMQETTPRPGAEARPSRTRGDALSDAAHAAKRSADALLEREQDRGRTMAGFAAGGGVLALLFGFAALAGIGQPQLFGVLSLVAILVPTVHAIAQSMAGSDRVADASYERGLCQGLAQSAKRLGDMVGATDQRNVPLGPEAVINLQLDSLYKDLNRARQRLDAAGAQAGIRAAPNRLHERLVPALVDAFLTASDGRRYPVRIVELSQSDVTIKGSLPSLHEQEQVQIGARRASVAKVGTSEASLQFLVPILPSEFTKQLVL